MSWLLAFQQRRTQNYEYARSSKLAFDWAGRHGQAPNEEKTHQRSWPAATKRRQRWWGCYGQFQTHHRRQQGYHRQPQIGLKSCKSWFEPRRFFSTKSLRARTSYTHWELIIAPCSYHFVIAVWRAKEAESAARGRRSRSKVAASAVRHVRRAQWGS